MWQGIDQRRFPRAKLECTVNLRKAGEGTPVRAMTENIGLGGVCVLLEKGMDIFSSVELELNLNDSKPPLKTGGTIVWVVRRRQLRKGASFDTGIEFGELTGEDRARIEAVIDKAGIGGKSPKPGVS